MRDALVTFATQLIVVILGMAVAIVIGKVLGPEWKVAYSLTILVPTLLALLRSLGIGGANLCWGASRTGGCAALASNALVSAVSSILLLRGNERNYV